MEELIDRVMEELDNLGYNCSKQEIRNFIYWERQNYWLGNDLNIRYSNFKKIPAKKLAERYIKRGIRR